MPQVKDKRSGRKENWSVNFSLKEFREKYPNATRNDMSEVLGITPPMIDCYRTQQRTPLSVYKAIIQKYAPDEAHKYELKLLVTHQSRSATITDATHRLARAYDQRSAGNKMTLADGSGYYRIAPEQAEFSPEVESHDVEVPLTPTPQPPEEVVILLQQQEALIAVLSRVTAHRDSLAIENTRQKQLLADRDGTITGQANQVKHLTQQVREWEELSRQEPLKGSQLSADPVLIADEILTRLRGHFNANGHTNLVAELERISPKQTGHLSSPRQNGRNGSSASFR